jgi:hypothetical protein
MPETGCYADNGQDNTEWATGIHATFKPRYFGMRFERQKAIYEIKTSTQNHEAAKISEPTRFKWFHARKHHNFQRVASFIKSFSRCSKCRIQSRGGAPVLFRNASIGLGCCVCGSISRWIDRSVRRCLLKKLIERVCFSSVYGYKYYGRRC